MIVFLTLWNVYKIKQEYAHRFRNILFHFSKLQA